MTDTDFLTNSEIAGLERDTKQAVEAAVAAVEQPGLSLEEVRQQLQDLVNEEAPSTVARQFAYGYVRLETDVVFREVDNHGRLHLVVAVAGDEIDDVLFWEIDGTLVEPSSQLDAHGTVQSGRFEHIARLTEKLGAPGQQVIPLLRDSTSVDSSFVGTGIAYLYGRFLPRQGIFSGDPPIRAIVRSRKPIDPRDGVQRWTINPIVMAYDLLIKSKRLGGAERSADEIDIASFQSAANTSEEIVTAIQQFSRTTRADSLANDQLLFPDDAVNQFQWGDVVQVFASGGQSLPGTLSAGVDYHVIPRRHRVGDIGEEGVSSIRLASSFANAMANTPIATGLISSDFQVQKVGEVRHVCSGSYRGKFSRTILQRILNTCGAKLTKRDGKIAVIAEAFPASVKTITAGDIEGNITLSNKVRLAQRTTSLTGKFVSPARLFQADDYPAVGGETFETIDKGTFAKRFDLDYVFKVSTAQRQALFEFRQRRQEKSISFAGKGLVRYDVKAGDVFDLDYPGLGLDSSTPFQCTSRRTFVDITNGAPKFRLDFTARQLEATTFDADVSEEELILASKLPVTQDPRVARQPGFPQIKEELFETIEGAGVRVKVTMSWESAGDPFFQIYQPQYKLSSDTDFIDLPRTTTLNSVILDLAPGVYDFRVITYNNFNVPSEPALTPGFEIKGLTATPKTVTGFSGAINGELANLSWDLHPDLDVRRGGSIEIRHHCDVAGGNSSRSLLLAGGKLNGDATFTQVAAKVGTYYIRAVDQLGIKGPFVEWSTDNVRPVPFAQTISAGVFTANDSNTGQVTFAEGPAWASTNPSNTVEIDNVNNVIRLQAANLISAEPLFSAIPLVSAVGSGGAVAAEGTYFFFNRIELDAVTRMRIETELDTTIVNIEDTFTQRGGLVSDFVSFSGIIDPSVCDAFLEARFTQDDPNASPVWTDWQRIDTRNFIHRAIEFRIRLFSFDSAFNIECNQAAIRARELGAAA